MVMRSSLARIRKIRYLHKKWDWRKHGVLVDDPPSQKEGTCWAYAAVAAVEASLQMQGINEKLSVQELIDCCNVSGGINGGSTVDAFRHIKLRGITTITDYPTSVEDQGRCRRCNENIREKVKIRDIGHVTDLSERSLMKAVKRRPLVVSFWAGDEFSEYKKGEINTGKGIYPKGGGVGVALHSCVLVGYDTEEGGVGEPGEGYWIIRNSYGEDWGDEGCMKMHRDLTNMFRFACYPEDAFLVHEP